MSVCLSLFRFVSFVVCVFISSWRVVSCICVFLGLVLRLESCQVSILVFDLVCCRILSLVFGLESCLVFGLESCLWT